MDSLTLVKTSAVGRQATAVGVVGADEIDQKIGFANRPCDTPIKGLASPRQDLSRDLSQDTGETIEHLDGRLPAAWSVPGDADLNSEPNQSSCIQAETRD